MRRIHLTFPCEGATLVGTLDAAPGETGLLIVTGGNELRSGPWASQAMLAARLAAAGHPVFRYDRRGVGDSSGPNLGFREEAADIAAALAAFREAAPQLTRIAAWGNCDAASALMLTGGAGCDGLILSNPWTIEDDNNEAPPEAIRAHYTRRLRDPRALLRLLSGKVSLRSLFASLRSALRPTPPPSSLAQDMAAGLARFAGPVAILLAERDRTAQAFKSGWPANDQRVLTCPGASHSFVEPAAREWLDAQMLEALRD